MTAGGYARRDARGMSGGPELVMTRAGATAEPRASSCRGMNGVKAAATRAAGVKSATVETATMEAASAAMKATAATMKSAPAGMKAATAMTSTAVAATATASSIGAACEQRGRCRDREDRGERQHGVSATGSPQHLSSPFGYSVMPDINIEGRCRVPATIRSRRFNLQCGTCGEANIRRGSPRLRCHH